MEAYNLASEAPKEVAFAFRAAANLLYATKQHTNITLLLGFAALVLYLHSLQRLSLSPLKGLLK